MKGNVIRLNIMHLNSVHLNSIGEVQSVSLKAGESTEDPVYPPTTYTLAANVSNGKVTATKNGTAISLPYVATEGDVIVLSVTPDEGYEFKGWLDGNKSNPRTVTMTGNVVLSASCVEIAKPTYTLSASVTNGKVSATLNGSAVNLPFTANEGDVIVLSVTPNDGYTFEGWNDGNTDNPRSITMTADVVLSAQCVEVVQPPVGKYIQFEDPAVEAICVANWSSDGIGLTEEDAAAVTSIGNVFSQNKEITSFNEFEHFTGVTSIRADWDNSISSYKGAFADCSNLRTIKLPASLVTLGQYSFYKCTSLSVDITDMLLNLTSIGQYAFYNCPITGKVVMPNISYIDRAQFYQTNISEVADMGKVTKLLGAQTGPFYNCDLMESITLPDTMTSIEGGPLYYCDRLTRIISRATTPPTIADWSFKGANIEVIYVPDASLEAYKTAVNWSAYADRIHPLSEIEGVVIEDGYELNSNGTLKESVFYKKVFGFLRRSLKSLFAESDQRRCLWKPRAFEKARPKLSL